METGTHKNTVLADKLDCDGELGIATMNDMDDWLTRDMAIAIINHLCSVFNITNSEVL